MRRVDSTSTFGRPIKIAVPSCDQKAYGTDRANLCLELKLKLTSFLENVLLLGSNEIILELKFVLQP